MKKVFFSKIIFSSSDKKIPLTDDDINLLKRLSVTFFNPDIHLSTTKEIKDENGEKIGDEITTYSPAGTHPRNNYTGVGGAIIKSGQIISKFYNRENPDDVTNEINDAEFKINFYYSQLKSIVAFKKINTFGEEEFNKAFQSILKDAIIELAESSDIKLKKFKVTLIPIMAKLTPENFSKALNLCAPIKEINFSYHTQDQNIQLNSDFDNLNANNFDFHIKSELSTGINLKNDFINNLFANIPEFIKISKDKNLLKNRFTISFSTVNGGFYSNTNASKYTEEIEEYLNANDLLNQLQEQIDHLDQKPLIFEN